RPVMVANRGSRRLGRIQVSAGATVESIAAAAAIFDRLPTFRLAPDFAGLLRYMRPARHVRAFWRCLAEELMTGTTRSSEGLDPRRRKLLFRAWHRGMREVDLIMGRFADEAIGDLAEADLAEFERLIEEVPDRDVLAWVTGEAPAPPDYDTA